MSNGVTLKATQKRLRLKDAEVCATAGVSIGTLHRVYSDHPTVTKESVEKIRGALETLRKQLVQSLGKAAG